MGGLFGGDLRGKLRSLQLHRHGSQSRGMLCGLMFSLLRCSLGGIMRGSFFCRFICRLCGFSLSFLFRQLSRPVCGIFCGLPRGQLRLELCRLLCSPRHLMLCLHGAFGFAYSQRVDLRYWLALCAHRLMFRVSGCLDPQTSAFPCLRSRRRKVPVLCSMKIRPGIKGRDVFRSLILITQPFVI